MRSSTRVYWMGGATLALISMITLATTATAGDKAGQTAGAAKDCAACAAGKMQVKAEVNAEALNALMGAKVSMVLVDARGTSESWIPGAVALTADADEQTIRQTLSDPNQVIVTYCGGPGCMMSASLANRLAELGYTHVIRYTGGVANWKKAGYAMADATTVEEHDAQATGMPGDGSTGS